MSAGNLASVKRAIQSYTPAQLQTLLGAIKRTIPQKSFYEFSKKAWTIVEPAMPFVENWHHGAICEHLEAVARGEIQYLIINQPPGTAKSLFGAVFWPAWIWSWWPEFRGLFTAYDGVLATRDSMRCRNIIISDWYQQNFAIPGGWSLSKDQDEKTYYENTKTGIRQAFGVGAGGTGFRGDGTLVDDPLSASQARSPKFRQRVLLWWDETMSSRQNDQRTGFRVIQGQRLHSDDLCGHMERRGGYEILRLPSEYDPKRCTVTCRTKKDGQKVYWEDPRTEQGELLFPERFPQSVIEQAKKDLGPAYEGQHQQNPVSSGGRLFKRSHWRFWKPDGVAAKENHPRPKGCYQGPARELPDKFDEIVISVDCAFKDQEENDFVDMKVIGRKGADRFILDRVHGRMDFQRTCKALKALCDRWPRARKKLIEDTANGPGIISMLKSKIPGLCPRTPKDSKTARAELTAPEIEAGNWYLPDGAPWLEEFVSEFAAFPLGSHDDEVDTLTQAAIEFMRLGGASNLAGLLAASEHATGVLKKGLVSKVL